VGAFLIALIQILGSLAVGALVLSLFVIFMFMLIGLFSERWGA